MVADAGVRVGLHVVAGEAGQLGPAFQEGWVAGHYGGYGVAPGLRRQRHRLAQGREACGRGGRKDGLGKSCREGHGRVVGHGLHSRATLGHVKLGPASCVFDSILEGTTAGHFVLDETNVAGFLDIRPVFKGHTLVVTRKHVETVAELEASVLGELMEAGRRVAAAQRAALGCAGTFFALNDVVSQSVPHVHLHVVPRTRGDGLRGFLWPRTRYSGEEEAASVAQRIREALGAPLAATGHAVPGPAGTGPVGPAPAAVLIRDANLSDAPALAVLLAGGSLRGSEDADDVSSYESALSQIAGGDSSAVLVAEMDTRVVGMCQLIWFRHLQERGGLCAEIESVHVAGAERGHGIGGLLLEAAVRRATSLGCYRVQLTSNRSRRDAHRFYERHGFEPSHVGYKRYL